MHKKKIPLSTIGNTLIMALVESINKLVLISHSELSDDCFKQVGRFARRCGCDVDIIAGEGLDSLLIQHPEIIEEVFNDFDRNCREFSEFCVID